MRDRSHDAAMIIEYANDPALLDEMRKAIDLSEDEQEKAVFKRQVATLETLKTYSYATVQKDSEWEVLVVQNGYAQLLPETYLDHDEAMAAGIASMLEHQED